jgi:hypothetical protein
MVAQDDPFAVPGKDYVMLAHHIATPDGAEADRPPPG